MKIAGFERDCAKHIRELTIALDGATKAQAAGQQRLVESSMRRAQACLEGLLDCTGSFADDELSAALTHAREALAAEEPDAQALRSQLRQFQQLLATKAHPRAATNHQLAYSGVAAR